ncbi:MAG: HlyD family efflux transporter periplasmic adaptor subunit [Oscillospiraceae bacterium]
MTEQKVKKRGWVKNAAIIFLTVMLVLTFFSNTIMNRSLPEVAVQYAQSGSITAKIRGTGAVTANESYEVKSEQARKVLSVPVKVGDAVKVDDTLVLFDDAESTQLKEAQDALDAAVLAYKKALVAATGADYAKENRDIQVAQKALDKAKADRLANNVSQQDLATAEQNVNTATTESEIQKAKVNALTDKLANLKPAGDNTSIYNQISARQTEKANAEKGKKTVEYAYKAEYDELVRHATLWEKADGDKMDVAGYTSALATNFATQLKAAAVTITLPYTGGIAPSAVDAQKMVDAYNAVAAATAKVDGIQSAINTLYASLDYGDSNYGAVKKELEDAKEKQVVVEGVLKKYQTALQTIKDKYTKWEAAETLVNTNQKALEDTMFALAEKRKADGKAQATESLDLADMQSKITKQTAVLEKLKAGGTGAVVKSKVNGIVKAINVTAGNTTDPTQALITVEVPDRGYVVNIPVTTEQSKRVKIGDEAEVTTGAWGEKKTTATLIGIKSDPQKPGTNKILVFKLSGDVESGAQLGIAIGERGANYETIVPTSAIRSDSNGSFVLAVTAKSSPLGNRYVAQRIDVKSVASDDTNTAVSGALTTSDMVVTTSTKPIEPGMQVRLPDAA